MTATITVTNTAGVGTNWTVNGNSRTWTNSAGTPPASWITTGANVGATASNLYSHIIRYPYLVPYLTPAFSSTNVITLRGSQITVTTNNYFSVTYTTNTGTNLSVVQVPFENVVGNTNRTNNAHWIVDGLNRYPYTNAFATNANVVTNLLIKGASPYQEVLGPIGFRGRTAILSNFFATNGFTKSLTNINPIDTNLIVYGGFRSDGSGGNSFQAGSNAIAAGNLSVALGNSALASNANTLAIGTGAIATNENGTAIGVNAIASGADGANAIGARATASGNFSIAFGTDSLANNELAVAVGNEAQATSLYTVALGAATASAGAATAVGYSAAASGTNSLAIGASAVSTYASSAALGPRDTAGTGVATTTTNQIRLGTANHTVSIPGQLLISGTQSNTTFRGTNIAGGSWSYPRYDISTIANGNNVAVPVGTNRFIRLSGTVTGVPSIVGIVGGATTGGTDGQEIIIHNDLGYGCAFVQSTSDPVPANRIETFDGTDVEVAANGWAKLIYSTSDSRWHLAAYAPLSSGVTATNAVGTLSGLATNLATYQSGANPALSANALTATITNTFQVTGTNNAQVAAGVSSNGTLFARGITGRPANIFEGQTTNGYAATFIRSNHTMVASNYATTVLGGGQPGLQEIGLPVRIFALTNNVTITNVTAATSWITNALWGTNWIAANVLTPGSTVRVRGYGFFSSVSATPCTFGLRSGNGLQLCTNTLALSTSVVNDFITFEASFTVRAVGASGTCYPAGTIAFPSSTGGANALAVRRLQNSAGAAAPGTVTIDTTAPLLLDFFITPGATTHGFTLQQCTAEVIP